MTSRSSRRNAKFSCLVRIAYVLGDVLFAHPSISGSGESGKTTIVKQMKIIHQNGFTRDELLEYRPTIYKNLVDSAQAIILQLRKLQIDCELPENRVCHFLLC
jgi:hypothetical protein